ncbi:MAG: hypothetical protein ACREMB_07180, partial [Candidatus Rokuibacteriota bacterium]
MRPLCAFDLDHTLVRSALDLAAVRGELRDLAVARGLALPPDAVRWTVEQTIRAVAARAPALRSVCWE